MNKNSLVILLFIFLFIGIGTTSAQSCFNERINIGKTEMNQGHYSQAVKYFNAAKTCPDKPENYETICNNWIKQCNEKAKALTKVTYRYTLSWQQVYPVKGNKQYYNTNYESDYLDKLNAEVLNKREGNYEYTKNGVPGTHQTIYKVYQILENEKCVSTLYKEPTEKIKTPKQSIKTKIIRVDCDLYGHPKSDGSKTVLADFSYTYQSFTNDIKNNITATYYYKDSTACRNAANEYFVHHNSDSVLCKVQWLYNDKVLGDTNNRCCYDSYNLLRRANDSIKGKNYLAVPKLLDSVCCTHLFAKRDSLGAILDAAVRRMIKNAKSLAANMEKESDKEKLKSMYGKLQNAVIVCSVNAKFKNDSIMLSNSMLALSEQIIKIYNKEINALKTNGKNERDYKNGLDELAKLSKVAPAECNQLIIKKRSAISNDMNGKIAIVLSDTACNSLDSSKIVKKIGDIKWCLQLCKLGISYIDDQQVQPFENRKEELEAFRSRLEERLKTISIKKE